MTGVYFISKEKDGSLLVPLPALFTDVSEYVVEYLHPLPTNQIVKIDSAGMGFVLMHRSAVKRVREKFPNQHLFAESNGLGGQFIGEDVSFFRKIKEAGIPVYAHTGAIVQHIKRFSLDADYYRLYWENKNKENPEED